MPSDRIFTSSSLSRCSASPSDSLACLVLEPRDGVSPVDVELRALDVVLRLHQRRRVLFVRDARLRVRLLDLGVGLLQLGLLLLNRPLQHRAVELHHDVSGFDLGAVGRELENLELARLHGRRQHDGPERSDLAAKLERIDELAARDVRRRDVRHGTAPDRREDVPRREGRRLRWSGGCCGCAGA